jgi:Ca2+-binding RTX toxin-like protein
VKRGASVSLLGGIAVVASLLIAPGASAATLVGDYQLQGTRASSGPGPALTDVGGTNSFQNDNVIGASRQVLAFPIHSGVRMSPAGLGGSDPAYSVVTTFRFDAVDGYRRILDPSNGSTSDFGLYVLDGRASLFGNTEFLSSNIVFANNVYATVALTSTPPDTTKVYVNGAEVVNATETVPVSADTLRLFKDNDSPTTDEDSAGAVSCIRVYSGALTDPEVAAIGASPACSAPPPPPTCKGKPATIVGTNGNDLRKGRSGKDVIVGLGGNDKLSGLAGSDVICGGSGKDTLKGGKGNDKLFGEAGKDTLKGGPGKDKLKGGAGKDKQTQ